MQTKGKEAILKWIRDRVDYSQEANRKPYTFHRQISFTDCLLPCIALLEPQLRYLYINSVIDEDMKLELESCSSINWLPQAIKLTPVQVPRDGNCLVHAASMAMWGVADSRNTLRDLMLMTVKINSNFKKRWWCQLMKDLQSLNINHSEVIEQEWNDVICSISDLGSSSTSIAVPHRFLEGIHIYILANILRRPVVVFTSGNARSLDGQDLQEDHIGGLYLPLEWPPIECCKTPIVLGYSLNHFCPLLAETQPRCNTSQQENQCTRVLPLVNRSLSFLPVRCIRDEEEFLAQDLVQSYLLVKEVKTADEMTSIPCAQMQLRPLEQEQNSLFECLELLKERLRQAKLLKNSKGHMKILPNAVQQNTHPFYDIEMSSQTEVVAVRQSQLMSPGKNREKSQEHNQIKHKVQSLCVTQGCSKIGNDKFGNLCFDCYTVLSQALLSTMPVVQNEVGTVVSHANYLANPERISANKQTSQHFLNPNKAPSIVPTVCPPPATLVPTAPPPPLLPSAPPPVVVPMVPSLAAVPTAPPMSLGAHPGEAPLLSMMADRCMNGCGYRCSRQTYPYCHECCLIKDNVHGSTTCGSSEIFFEKVKPQERIYSAEGTKGVSDSEIFNRNTIQITVPSSYSSFEPSICNSSQFLSSGSSWPFEIVNLSHSSGWVCEESKEFPESESEVLMDKNCKHFEHCSGVRMLDHDICFSCAKGQGKQTNSAEIVLQLPASTKPTRNRTLAATEETSEGIATSFAEINVENLSGDIEVSEEPSSPGTLIFPHDKLCRKCQDIVGTVFQQTHKHNMEIQQNIASETQTSKEEILQTEESRSPQKTNHSNTYFPREKTICQVEENINPLKSAYSKLEQFVSTKSGYHVPQAKHCVTALCPNYGDPMMDNKCSSCYYKSNPSARLQHGIEKSSNKEPYIETNKESYKETNKETNKEANQESHKNMSTHKTEQLSPLQPLSRSLHVQERYPSGFPEDKPVMATSMAGHKPFESLSSLPADSSYSFMQSQGYDFEKKFKGINEIVKRDVKKCVSPRCANYGNRSNNGYCNACFKIIIKQRVLEQEARYGVDVPDGLNLDCT